MENDKIRVIIVDDHKLVRETWKMILESDERIEVVKECASGAEVITACSGHDPHIILMDVNMSPVNGFEATRQILQTAPQIRIIGLSINNQPVYARNMIRLGARGYVTKNSTKDEMIRAIEAVMNGETYICREVMSKMGFNET